jgi:hypothetical protein
MYRLAPPERVLAGEWIVKYDDAICTIRIALKMGNECSESERASIARAQGILKARLIDRRLSITEVNLSVVDNELVRRAGNSAAVCGFCLRDGKSGVEIVKQLIDSALIWLHHLSVCASSFVRT